MNLRSIFICIVTRCLHTVASELRQSYAPITLHKLAGTQDVALALSSEMPDIQDLQLPGSLYVMPPTSDSSIPEPAALDSTTLLEAETGPSYEDSDVSLLPQAPGFLHAPRLDDGTRPTQASQIADEDTREELLARASKLEQELDEVRQDLQPSSAHQIGRFHSVKGQDSTNDKQLPGGASTDDASSVVPTAAEVSDHAAETSDNASVYAKFGMFAGLALQICVVSAVGGCLVKFDLVQHLFEEDYLPLFAMSICVLLVSDIVWVALCLSGIMDRHIKEFVIVTALVLLVLGHIAMIGFVMHMWAAKKRSDIEDSIGNNGAYKHYKQTVGIASKLEHQIEQICEHMKLPRMGLSHICYDSESERVPDKEQGKKKDRKPLKVTIKSAKGLQMPGSADATDHMDAFATCAVRGRQPACNERTKVCTDKTDGCNPIWDHPFDIMDFRIGDTLKLKVWDSDSLVIGHGKSKLIGTGKLKPFTEDSVPQIKEKEHTIQLELDGKETGEVVVSIEAESEDVIRMGGIRSSTHGARSEAKETLEGLESKARDKLEATKNIFNCCAGNSHQREDE